MALRCNKHHSLLLWVIADDASTDNELEVIRQFLKERFDLDDSQTVRKEDMDEYSKTISAKNNSNCYFAVYLLEYNHYNIRKPRLPYYFKECINDIKYLALSEYRKKRNTLLTAS